MATPAQIRTACDTKLSAALATLQSRQSAFLTNQGRYWQGLRSHSVTPAEGVEAAPTVGTSTPSDIAQSWPAAYLAGTYPMSLQVNVYDGPGGKGWEAVLEVDIGGLRWRRVYQEGPETGRAQGWTQIPSAP